MRAKRGNFEVELWQIHYEEAEGDRPTFVNELFERGKILWRQNFFGAWVLSAGSSVGADSAIEGFWLLYGPLREISFVSDKRFQKDFEFI